MRPSDLGSSGRRDLVGYLARSSMALSGLDLWIPVEAFLDDARIERAVDATIEAIDLAADLQRCTLSLLLPGPGEGQVDAAIEMSKARALQQGVGSRSKRLSPDDQDLLQELQTGRLHKYLSQARADNDDVKRKRSDFFDMASSGCAPPVVLKKGRVRRSG